jgi:HEAT repeat protein
MLESSDKQQRERSARLLRVLAQRMNPPFPFVPPPREAAGAAVLAMLVVALDDDNVRVRQEAALGLAALGSGAQEATSALVRHLADSPLVSKPCGDALRNLGPPGIKALIDSLGASTSNFESSAYYQLALAATTSEMKFYQAIRDPNLQDDSKLSVVVANMEASAGAGVPAIVAALKRPDPKARELAAKALLHINKSLTGLIRKLPPPDPNAWDDEAALRQRGEKASTALQLVVRDSRRALQAAVADDNPNVREQAAAALKALGPSDEKP